MAEEERRREEEKEEGGGAPEWMVTFSDMTTLLLTFFVLLLSFSNQDIQKFREMLGSIKDAFGVQKVEFGEYAAKSIQPFELGEKKRYPVALSDTALAEAIREAASESGISQDQIEVKLTDEGVRVRLKGKIFFAVGSAKLKENVYKFLDSIIEIMRRTDYELAVEGHTDNIPIRTREFPSNWELSAARAAVVVRYLVEKGGIDPKRLKAVGYADSRPLVPNDTPEHRAMNRRVEFLFVNPFKTQG